jgi:hypothetical protein
MSEAEHQIAVRATFGLAPYAACSCGWRGPRCHGPRRWWLAWEWGMVHRVEAAMLGGIVSVLGGSSRS